MIVETLFCKEKLDVYLKRKMNLAKEEVRKIPMDRNVDFGEMATKIYRKTSVEPLILYKDQETTEVIKIEKENKELKEMGLSIMHEVSVYIFSIPYIGDKRLFGCTPSIHYMLLPNGKADNEALTIAVEKTNSIEHLKKEHDQIISNIEYHVENINKQVDAYNNRLKNYLQQEILGRFKKEQEEIEKERELGLPPRKKNTTVIDIPLIEPQISIGYKIRKDVKNDTVLSGRSYEEILEGIRYMASSMERCPGPYSNMGEEDLRQCLLTSLNGMLHIRGTAESFNNKGKTDILYTKGDKNLFIAECKKWKGNKYVMDGIKQLEGYLSWGDT